MGFCSDVEDICSLSLTAVHGLMERQNISYSDIGHLQVFGDNLCPLFLSPELSKICVRVWKKHLRLAKKFPAILCQMAKWLSVKL